MPKATKKTTVVEYFQVGANTSFLTGLGTLATTDYVLRLSDNSLKTLSCVQFGNLYNFPSDENTTLQGTDWN